MFLNFSLKLFLKFQLHSKIIYYCNNITFIIIIVFNCDIILFYIKIFNVHIAEAINFIVKFYCCGLVNLIFNKLQHMAGGGAGAVPK